MKILTISGSARNDSSNAKLLDALPMLFPEYKIYRYQNLQNLPLFHADIEKQSNLPAVSNWKTALATADAVVICTPEYLHNVPALLKNALEWITTSGELFGKKVLPMTFTPHAPRGEKAMQSLLWSLQALNAHVVAQLALYQNEITFNEQNELVNGEALEMLQEAIYLL